MGSILSVSHLKGRSVCAQLLLTSQPHLVIYQKMPFVSTFWNYMDAWCLCQEMKALRERQQLLHINCLAMSGDCWRPRAESWKAIKFCKALHRAAIASSVFS